MDLKNPSFVEGARDGGDKQSDLFENQDRDEQKDFNKCSNISRDEDECSNKTETMNESDSVNLVENEINAFCSPGQEEEECDQDLCNEESEEEQSYMSAGCSEAGSTDEFDVKLRVIFFIFMLTTLIQPPDNTFHRKAFSKKYIHSVNGKSCGAALLGYSQNPENNYCNNQCGFPNVLSKTSCTGNISLKTAKDESYEICCKCKNNRHVLNIENTVAIENSTAKGVDSRENCGVQINRYDSIYSFQNIDNDNCSIPGCDRLGNTSLAESSDATTENIKKINQKKLLPYYSSSKEVNWTADEKNWDRVTKDEKLTGEQTHYQLCQNYLQKLGLELQDSILSRSGNANRIQAEFPQGGMDSSACILNYILNITNRCKEDATNSDCYSKDLEKTYFSKKGFPEGTPLQKIYEKKKDAHREILNDHSYRNILGRESYNYQHASLFKIKQDAAILDTKLLDHFHPMFSRSHHHIAVFLLNGVINDEEDPELDDENVLNEGHDNNIEFNETQVATNTEIAEKHVTSAEEDGSSGDNVEGDQFQLSFIVTLEHEAGTFGSNGVDSVRSYSINGENDSNNGVTYHNVNEEENQNIISNESLAIVVVPNQNGHIPENLLLTEVEHNDLNLEHSTIENSCVAEENKKAI